jgi:hypothetical protein
MRGTKSYAMRNSLIAAGRAARDQMRSINRSHLSGQPDRLHNATLRDAE